MAITARKTRVSDAWIVRLPPPRTKGGMPLVRALALRRSGRSFAARMPSREEVSQLCWAGQGITDRGLRTAPSAGALFPIELLILDRNGVWEYLPAEHTLRRSLAVDARPPLVAAALDQAFVGTAPMCMVIAAEVPRTARVYAARSERYCMLEAGHVAQNVLLQATALGLVGVVVGAFHDRGVASVLGLRPTLSPIYLLPIGHAA